MIKIKISTETPTWPLIRQTPGSKGMWGDCQFFINQNIKECDWWFVYDNLSEPEVAVCPTDHVVLITAEPPSLQLYDPEYLNQFSTVISSHTGLPHPNVLHTQQALPWHFGVRRNRKGDVLSYLSFDDLIKLKPANVTKSNLISVISSDKAISRGHKQRLRFIDSLLSHFGDQIDFFGRGFREVEDKWEAIIPYKYHIVLENYSIPDYFTEKLADAFLGWSYPIYYGCSNIMDYFSPGSLTTIDISDFNHSIHTVEKVISSNTFEQQSQFLAVARDLILNQYNIFPMITAYSHAESQAESGLIKLMPQKSGKDMFTRVRRAYHILNKYGFRKIQNLLFERYFI